MGRKRITFTDKFKAKVAIEAIKGVKTLAELASEHKDSSEPDLELEEAGAFE